MAQPRNTASGSSYDRTRLGGRGNPSPPASTYFPLLSSDRLRPTQDAESHFAYSTTLRRHHVDVADEAVGLWDRVTGNQPSRRSLEDGQTGSAGRVAGQVKDTVSARFAHTSIQDTVAYYNTNTQSGLPASIVSSLLARYGYNEFSVSTPEPLYIKFFKTIYESPLILLLVASATVSALMGNIDDAVSITVAVAIVVTVGFVQERRSEKSLEALNKLVPHHCHVLRDSQVLHILANELVPGDVVQLSTGDRVPADIRLTETFDLEIDESSLTGETDARRKTTETCSNDHGIAGNTPVALAERHCIGYMGTLVRNGRGMGVVIATGTETEFGVIFSMMQEVEEKRTPLQLSMDELAQKLSMASFGVIGIICLIGLWQNRSWLEMFTIGVSLAVAAIPEGLPIVTTVTLALGVLRMAKRKAIVKKLHSVEALGSVSVVCSDKTGTLTKNEMTVVEAYAVDETVHIDPATRVASHVETQSLNPIANSGSHFNASKHSHSNSLSVVPSGLSPALKKTLEVGALCNNASTARNGEGALIGQSTEVALLEILNVWGMSDPRQTFTRNAERPFNSEQKYMAVSGVHTTPTNQREMYYTKGALSSILDRCKFYYVSDESTPGLDAATRNLILAKAHAAASRGLRVIAMAYGYGGINNDAYPSRAGTPGTRAPSPERGDDAKNNLVFVGFQAMFDPPRKGVADSIALLQSGGVQVVMITGDAEETALSIARTLGLRVPSERDTKGSVSGFVLTGKMIDQMSKSELRERVASVSVFARTTPRHKMAIVEAFQSRGKVVAMTGDGVNDAPALKMADIGVSMGKSGTDVAKEAADVILVDDNFSTILPAVEEGKSIFHNIQNFLAFQLSTAAAALTLITLSTMFGLSNPLNAMQILFINILMDGPPSQSLGVDPVDPAVMRKPPRKKDAPIITKRLLLRVMFSASIIVFGTLFIYFFALSDDHMSRREQTMTFTCFVFLDLVSAVQNRGMACGLTQNRMLVVTVSISFLTQLALIYVPMMQAIFQTESLRTHDLGILLGLAAASMTLHEGRRRYERKLNMESTWAEVVEEMV